jgi:hypothetical protein
MLEMEIAGQSRRGLDIAPPPSRNCVRRRIRELTVGITSQADHIISNSSRALASQHTAARPRQGRATLGEAWPGQGRPAAGAARREVAARCSLLAAWEICVLPAHRSRLRQRMNRSSISWQRHPVFKRSCGTNATSVSWPYRAPIAAGATLVLFGTRQLDAMQRCHSAAMIGARRQEAPSRAARRTQPTSPPAPPLRRGIREDRPYPGPQQLSGPPGRAECEPHWTVGSGTSRSG